MSKSDENADRVKAHWNAQSAKKSQGWTSNGKILEYVLKNISGSNKFWLNWLFEDHIKRPIDNLLSLGCGTGGHEFIMARTGLVSHIDAFDISPSSIASARERALAEGVKNISFEEKSFEDFISNPPNKKYDAICFFGSLHHVTPIEDVLFTCRSLMSDNSILIFNEYTGYMYALPSPKTESIIEEIHKCIHPKFINDGFEKVKFFDLEHMLKHDPSEGVRAPLIIPILRQIFDVSFLKATAGPILHRYYSHLNHDFANSHTPEAETIMNLLIFIEEILLKNQVLDPDFHIGICKLKKAL
ncbi:hypothetical protein CRT60_00725 [Azospirillum palustre]|uniref:Methyltransferase domain-containing protein n=1 Tax=Azospirillum palustre TaxID=2044885 RepID=A0A2B8BCW8_9PROT|nr:methyltransferase domain-containing protein [Azospirillum palustre]PGH59194.1 hypothetical protein CRT60_00725 [Azospirillum palustre]